MKWTNLQACNEGMLQFYVSFFLFKVKRLKVHFVILVVFKINFVKPDKIVYTIKSMISIFDKIWDKDQKRNSKSIILNNTASI